MSSETNLNCIVKTILEPVEKKKKVEEPAPTPAAKEFNTKRQTELTYGAKPYPQTPKQDLSTAKRDFGRAK